MRSHTNLPVHPLRSRVLDELHARPFEPIRAPAVILRYVFWREAEIDAFQVIKTWCQTRGFDVPKEHDRRYNWKDGSASLTYETHTEFVSISWMGDPEHVPESDPFSVFGTPGPILGNLINAVRINVRSFGQPGDKKDQKAEGVLDLYDFDPGSLCMSKASNEQAIIATDFRQNEFGLTQFAVIDLGMRAINCGALVRRIAEIETYRAVALLGLPEAQRISPELTKLEKKFSDTFSQLQSAHSSNDNQALLDNIYQIAMDLETMMMASQYRFDASRAYVGIVEDRLNSLDESEHLGYTPVKTFLLKRVTPAIQTCGAIERRQNALAEKITRASDLLRTQLDLDLQAQNQSLLKALNERSEQQYRLQQTVEGLSVVAISYYAVSLLYYLYRGIPGGLGIDTNVLVTLSIPAVVLGVWYAIRRIRGKQH